MTQIFQILKTQIFTWNIPDPDPYPVDALPTCHHAEDVCNNDPTCRNKGHFSTLPPSTSPPSLPQPSSSAPPPHHQHYHHHNRHDYHQHHPHDWTVNTTIAGLIIDGQILLKSIMRTWICALQTCIIIVFLSAVQTFTNSCPVQRGQCVMKDV